MIQNYFLREFQIDLIVWKNMHHEALFLHKSGVKEAAGRQHTSAKNIGKLMLEENHSH